MVCGAPHHLKPEIECFGSSTANGRTATRDVRNPFGQGLTEHPGSTGHHEIPTSKRVLHQY